MINAIIVMIYFWGSIFGCWTLAVPAWYLIIATITGFVADFLVMIFIGFIKAPKE